MSKDKRVIKTEKLITETMMRLLATTSISKITVKKICDEALISKSTFYDHYVDKFDVIDKVVDEYAMQFNREIQQRFEAVQQKNTFEIFNKIIKDMANQDSDLLILMSLEHDVHSVQDCFHKILYDNAHSFLSKQKMNNRFSVAFLSQIYADLALTSISFTLKHAENKNLLEEQSDFMNLMQEVIISNVKQ
ncbi:TetR/AcrR family transcriptional regulator [Leuconostoc suionicum]|uniref:TetR/AcrR family transcriptional regulator n=1 Tax=Leuconostoc suionicum TaxID=1511761 RepID=UPI0024AC9DB1|nr:TetR/AcrR family transcriptional regulator [Leuconostoc suionicum]MDI6650868.1 TetR/AcrR family transcriptional regulator [Leuconostoc suionicum]MDI6681241.1 TetR/AcrR family transcriptional regulator [Leuconostoc suionicum]